MQQKSSATALVISAPAKRTLKKVVKSEAKAEAPSDLSQQLRSVYASERINAVIKITGKEQLSSADIESLALALREDPSPNVRLTILDALRPMSGNPNVQAVLISALNKQDDEAVQTAMLDLLIDKRSRQAIPQMIALMDDKNTNVILQNKIKAGIESFLN